MARYIGSGCKMCRREGSKLFLKGERCMSDKCAFERRPVAPGQHGAARKKQREYGMQLREKQKVKRYYGLLEKQFNNYFREADRLEGMAGENLLVLLERRLDNAVFRMGIGDSRKETRQIVLHGHILVNGKKVNIPSYRLRVGDVVSVAENSRKSERMKNFIESMQKLSAPKWLELNANDAAAKVVALPVRDDIEQSFNEQLIVELYSK